MPGFASLSISWHVWHFLCVRNWEGIKSRLFFSLHTLFLFCFFMDMEIKLLLHLFISALRGGTKTMEGKARCWQYKNLVRRGGNLFSKPEFACTGTYRNHKRRGYSCFCLSWVFLFPLG